MRLKGARRKRGARNSIAVRRKEMRTEALGKGGMTGAGAGVEAGQAPWWGRAGQALAVAGALALTATSLWGQEPEPECECPPGARAFVFPDMQAFQLDLRRGRIGISLDASQGDEFDAVGARVRSVVPGGPADEVGIREGDVITDVGGQSLLDPLADPEDEERLDLDESVPVQRLLAIAGDLEAGDTVEIRYRRDGESHSTSVVVDRWMGDVFLGRIGDRNFSRIRLRELRDRVREEALERSDEARALHEDALRLHLEAPQGERVIRIPRIEWEGMPGRPGITTFDDPCLGEPGGWRADACASGLTLAPMNSGLSGYFGTDRGALVLHVGGESTLGLEPGDVILAIGDREVRSPSQARRILRSYESGEEVTFRIVRRQAERTVTGTMD